MDGMNKAPSQLPLITAELERLDKISYELGELLSQIGNTAARLGNKPTTPSLPSPALTTIPVMEDSDNAICILRRTTKRYDEISSMASSVLTHLNHYI